ncbi:MAG TPA: PEP-CTERM sorting domain-containing protein [Verrucomicrobiota bacterium]|nr:PEP-CTERM sorting domain-containing protein [Verrucomicrobiota bacterium]HNT14470.1 PEP-CTERM sorting domain-containing protein [Verrucomicrobiota bacterium]
MQLKLSTSLTGARLLPAILVATSLVLTAETHATSNYTLTDGASTALIDADSGAGMYSWVVGGQEHLKKQWFYYRIGDTDYAAPINAISTSTLLGSAANILALNYANAQVSLTVTYVLTSSGQDSADIQETISVQNVSDSPLNFHFFQYSDFNLSGTSGDDTVVFLGSDSVKQTELSFGIQEGIISPSSSHLEAGFAGTGGTLDKLLSIPGYNLNDNGGPLTGDVTWSFQWDHVLQAGESLEILKDKTLISPVIPEPTTAALILLGVAALAVSQRRQSD